MWINIYFDLHLILESKEVMLWVFWRIFSNLLREGKIQAHEEAENKQKRKEEAYKSMKRTEDTMNRYLDWAENARKDGDMKAYEKYMKKADDCVKSIGETGKYLRGEK